LSIVEPLINWVGGKWNLADWIIPHLPTHYTYVEPFGGAMAVLLQKPRSDVEVYNDIDGRLVNLWRVVRDRPEELRRRLQLTLYSREEYLDAREKLLRGEVEDELERAALFFTTIRQGFAAVAAQRRTGWAYAVTIGSPTSAWLRAIDETLPAVSERIRSVQIENLDWRKILKVYDSPDTCFYLDPPYVPTATRAPRIYRHHMTVEDHVELCEKLNAIKGKAVLSGYPNEIYDTMLKSWQRLTLDRAVYSMPANGTRPRATEVLWINRPGETIWSRVPFG
jgi:DNA adenine methylase